MLGLVVVPKYFYNVVLQCILFDSTFNKQVKTYQYHYLISAKNAYLCIVEKDPFTANQSIY